MTSQKYKLFLKYNPLSLIMMITICPPHYNTNSTEKSLTLKNGISMQFIAITVIKRNNSARCLQTNCRLWEFSCCPRVILKSEWRRAFVSLMTGWVDVCGTLSAVKSPVSASALARPQQACSHWALGHSHASSVLLCQAACLFLSLPWEICRVGEQFSLKHLL